jgi:hypothetical protein
MRKNEIDAVVDSSETPTFPSTSAIKARKRTREAGRRQGGQRLGASRELMAPGGQVAGWLLAR